MHRVSTVCRVKARAMFLFCDDVIGADKLTLCANGGDGTDGGDGGDGEDGKDGENGEEISNDDFERKFPEVCYSWLTNDDKCVKAVRTNRNSVAIETRNESLRSGLGCSQYVAGKTSHGLPVTFSFYDSPHLFGSRQAYVLVKGTPGTLGEAGGDGSCAVPVCSDGFYTFVIVG